MDAPKTRIATSDLPLVVRVGVGDLYASARPAEILTSYALGSCVGVVVHDRVATIGGLAHVQLPECRRPQSQEADGIFAYADYAVPELLSRVYSMGATRQRLRVVLVGGALLADPDAYFQVGRKNVLAVRRHLWAHGLIPAREDVGANYWRTLHVHIGSGRILVTSPHGREEL
jgi:chemotaxis protein CheD